MISAFEDALSRYPVWVAVMSGFSYRDVKIFSRTSRTVWHLAQRDLQRQVDMSVKLDKFFKNKLMFRDLLQETGGIIVSEFACFFFLGEEAKSMTVNVADNSERKDVLRRWFWFLSKSEDYDVRLVAGKILHCISASGIAVTIIGLPGCKTFSRSLRVTQERSTACFISYETAYCLYPWEIGTGNGFDDGSYSILRRFMQEIEEAKQDVIRVPKHSDMCEEFCKTWWTEE